MVLALRLSATRGMIEHDEVDALVSLLQRASLPVNAPDTMSGEEFMRHMRRDKKVVDGRLRLILLREMGVAEVVDDVTEPELMDLFNAKN